MSTALTLQRRRLALLALALVAIAAAAWAWLHLHRPAVPDGVLQINGRIEGDRVTIASKLAGRVAELAAREGDVVKADQLLVRLDDRAVRARVEQASAAADSLRAQVAAEEAALKLLRSETTLALRAAGTRVDAAGADLQRAQAAMAQEARDQARARDLQAQGFIGPQSLERATLAVQQSTLQHDAAQALLAQAEQGRKDAALGPQRVRAREAELGVAQARLQQALAALAEARSALDDLTIRAPAAGTVTGRFTNLGEVVNAGTPLLELTDLGQLYLKGYLAETQLGRVQRGMPAQIRVDAHPGEAFDATVRYIASRAEFTPKEVQTVDERVKLVYELRLYVDRNPGGRLTPGQPADGFVRWRESQAWQTRQP